MGTDKTNEIIKHLILKNKMNPKDNPFNGLNMEQLEEIAKSWQAAKKILQTKEVIPK